VGLDKFGIALTQRFLDRTSIVNAMTSDLRRRSFLFVLSGACIAFCWHMAGGADNAAPTRTATDAKPVDFARDVVPILQSSCISCHANGLSKGGFRLDTRELMLKGGDSGDPAIVPGKSKDSPLIDLVSETDATVVMPKKGPHLTPVQIQTMKNWIDQGAVWPANVNPGRFKEAALAPRRPVIPAATAGSGLTDSIDLILQPYYVSNGIHSTGKVVDDRIYARRAYLDTIGLLPSPDDLNAFVADTSPDKREQLVHRLLSDNRRYAEHWLSFWNDLLRNDYQGTGYIDGGRTQITTWLFNALQSNMPYDQFVRELVTGANGSAGFTNGIVWRGTVNASQSPPLQAAQNISQVFMGVNLKCASCHDSFVSNWKLADAYGLAAVFADGPLEMQRCDHPLGTYAPLKFLYPELGQIDANATKPDRAKQLAAAITNEKNGRLTRTIVNRLWRKTMGRALIEPCDEMDNDPWDADLLDELSVELSDHGYDLKQTLFTILTSRAYQLPAVVQEGERDDKFVFKGPLIRRMSAEQCTDAISTVTGVWPKKPAARPANEGTPSAPEIRSALCIANPLSTALGRPNRDQVVTERASAATTLQALELTNGSTLNTMLNKAAMKILSDKDATPAQMIAGIYQRALGREPTKKELALAMQTVGSPATQDGTEDLLWAVFMLPEFQLIR
jgi:mono/diheme cytochrome c family protein